MRSVDIETRLRDLAAGRHGAFRRDDAERRGISQKVIRRRILSGLLEEPAPGVLVHTAFAAGWKRQLSVATLAGAGSVASHRAAVALHLPDVFGDPPVEVTVDRRHRTSAPLAIVHRSGLLVPEDVMVKDSIPVTTLAVALASLGSVAPADVERALDAARRSNVNVKWLRQTAERLHRPGQRGPRMLLDLLDELEPGEAVRGSWFEKLVETTLRTSLLPPLVRQYVVRDGSNRFLGRLDGAYPAIKLGIEAHSREFHFGSGPESADEARDLALASVGWEVLYIGWHRTRSSGDEILRQVFGVAMARGWDPVSRSVRPPDRAA